MYTTVDSLGSGCRLDCTPITKAALTAENNPAYGVRFSNHPQTFIGDRLTKIREVVRSWSYFFAYS